MKALILAASCVAVGLLSLPVAHAGACDLTKKVGCPQVEQIGGDYVIDGDNSSLLGELALSQSNRRVTGLMWLYDDVPYSELLAGDVVVLSVTVGHDGVARGVAWVQDGPVLPVIVSGAGDGLVVSVGGADVGSVREADGDDPY